jgi:hypothetical protein
MSVTRSHVFYLNQHEKLVALAADTGTEAWSRHLGDLQAGLMGGIYGWLHAVGDTIIVGGWRGYQDIFCLNAYDGTVRWSYPAKGEGLFGTYLYPEMGSVMIATRDQPIIRNVPLDSKAGSIKGDSRIDGSLLFIDIKSGEEVLQFILPGSWITWSCDRIAKPVDDSSISVVIFKEDNNSFFRVSGNPPTIESFIVDQSIWSINLIQVGEVVPFMSNQGSLIAYSVTSKKSLELAKITHNRRDMLPFLVLQDGSFVVGTSIGMVYFISSDTKLLAKRKIGKRVSTNFSVSDGIVCCGTASGEIIGMQVP